MRHGFGIDHTSETKGPSSWPNGAGWQWCHLGDCSKQEPKEIPKVVESDAKMEEKKPEAHISSGYLDDYWTFLCMQEIFRSFFPGNSDWGIHTGKRGGEVDIGYIDFLVTVLVFLKPIQVLYKGKVYVRCLLHKSVGETNIEMMIDIMHMLRTYLYMYVYIILYCIYTYCVHVCTKTCFAHITCQICSHQTRGTHQSSGVTWVECEKTCRFGCFQK